MHGQGGWPLSVFLTPNLKPFYGGTYFPPVPRHGLPGFPQVLEFIADVWKNKQDEIIKDSDEMIKNLQNGRRANRDARIYGKVVAEWKTGAPVAGADGTPAAPAWKTVDGVRLANGSLITLSLIHI